jgi:hypothetical protein
VPGAGQAYEEGRRLLGEVNAAIDGAIDGGATEIVGVLRRIPRVYFR